MSAPQWRIRQYHYLSENSHVHPFLVDLWREVEQATDGRAVATVTAGPVNIDLTAPTAQVARVRAGRVYKGGVRRAVCVGSGAGAGAVSRGRGGRKEKFTASLRV